MAESSLLAASVSSAPFWVWWLVPVVVTMLVVGAIGLSRRERRPRDGFEAVDDYTRFRQAMAHVRAADQERR